MRSSGYRTRSKSITIAALLTAFGILIPLLMPFKIIIGPASYTLGSHIPINIALFHSGTVGAIVSLGTTLGFLMAGFPIVITMRAFSHIIYVLVGQFFLSKKSDTLATILPRALFNMGINIIHALGEVIVVYLLTSSDATTQNNYFYTLFILVGVGTFIHGCIDFELSYYITRLIQQRTSIQVTTLDL